MDRDEIARITDYIFLENEDKRADVALIFGTRHWQYPLDKVLGLYNHGLVAKMVFSGGINRHTKRNEAQRMKQEAIKAGIIEDDIILEDSSTNTLENVLFSGDVLSQRVGFENIKSIIAIVKNYHSRRALMTMKRHFPEHIALKSCPYSIYGFTKETWHISELGREKVFGELGKIRKYLAKDNLAEL